jgi:hypothetical protein
MDVTFAASAGGIVLTEAIPFAAPRLCVRPRVLFCIEQIRAKKVHKIAQ